MDQCLYHCPSTKRGSHEYHIYPASASVLSLELPRGIVCDKCNNYFSKLEKYFIDNHPGADFRILYVPRTRKGKAPKSFSKAGEIVRTDIDGMHELKYPLSGFEYRFQPNGDILIVGTYERFPYDSVKISRVLAKMAMESVCKYRDSWRYDPHSGDLDELRHFARFGPRRIKYVWFAWKPLEGKQGIPRLVRIRNSEGHDVADLCRLHLPGIAYLIPLPPIPEPSEIRANLKGWNVLESPGEYANQPGTIQMTLKRVERQAR